MISTRTRAKAAQATLDRYKDLPFSFEQNRDCAKMTLFHLKKMGRPVVKLSAVGSYKSANGARAALRRMGVSDLAELADKHFPRIAPAEALVGDLIELEGNGPLGTLSIYVGNGMVLTYHEDAVGAVVARLAEAKAAWRVE
jgi:hypothetical protein